LTLYLLFFYFFKKIQLMTEIKDFPKFVGKEVEIQGWVANKRSSKGIEFIIFRDGSGFTQCVVNQDDAGIESYETARNAGQEASLKLRGTVVKDERQIGGYELQVNHVQLIGKSENYPVSNKEHGPDFLMDHRHLWLRSQRQWSIMQIRNTIIFSIHEFFQKEGFIQADAPIFTANAAEGTTTLFETDFYGQPAYLSQSGQLYGEAMALALGKIYTFGPTFRAEKSKTRRHLSEFWMIEPEMAFFDNDMNMDLIEKFLKHVLSAVLEKNAKELKWIERNTETFEAAVKESFPRLTYAEAVDILKGKTKINGKTTTETLQKDLEDVKNRMQEIQTGIEEREEQIKAGVKKGKRNFLQRKIDELKVEYKKLSETAENIPEWLKSIENFKYGSDFGGSDETVLTRMFKVPVMVYNWPHEIKAFYMKRDKEAPELAKGVDVLAPEGYGEIVGGGERETDGDLLIEKIHEHKLPVGAFEWYLDLRRYGTVKHAGFGLGLERMVAWICGLKHIRETIPFPRMYGRVNP
jgi:asparaginyl-tRNA synthetase